MEQTYLITGCAGFIGFHLSKRLLSEGKTVIGVDNLNSYYDVNLKYARLSILEKETAFQFHRCDIAEQAPYFGILGEHHPEIVIHLAAQAGVRYSIDHPESYLHSNLIGFFNVLEGCRHYPVKHLLYASSSSVYGGNAKVPFSEDDRVDHPVSLYAATKKSNELMAYTYSHLYGIPSTGLRFFTVYGPWGRPDMAYFSFSQAILKGEPIPIFNGGNLYRDFTYIDDIIEGICRILHHPPQAELRKDGGKRKAEAKVYNIGNNKPVQLMEFIAILEHCLGKTAKKTMLPMQPGDVYQTYADLSALQQDFGFQPRTSLEDGLQLFVEWFLGEYYHE